MNTNEIIEHRIKILKAWNTQEIQYRIFDDRWPGGGRWFTTKQKLPKFEKYEYRIKPELSRYRVGLCCRGNDNFYPKIFLSEDESLNFPEGSSYSYFVRWLTDWIEYEVS